MEQEKNHRIKTRVFYYAIPESEIRPAMDYRNDFLKRFIGKDFEAE
jgi:hypothetical protein